MTCSDSSVPILAGPNVAAQSSLQSLVSSAGTASLLDSHLTTTTKNSATNEEHLNALSQVLHLYLRLQLMSIQDKKDADKKKAEKEKAKNPEAEVPPPTEYEPGPLSKGDLALLWRELGNDVLRGRLLVYMRGGDATIPIWRHAWCEVIRREGRTVASELLRSWESSLGIDYTHMTSLGAQKSLRISRKLGERPANGTTPSLEVKALSTAMLGVRPAAQLQTKMVLDGDAQDDEDEEEETG